MAERNSTVYLNKEPNYAVSQRKDLKFLKTVNLLFLLFLWIGYACSLYSGEDNKTSNYSLLILAFSLINFNTMCGEEKLENKVLNILAKLEGVLYFIWVFITVIQLFLK